MVAQITLRTLTGSQFFFENKSKCEAAVDINNCL